MARHQISGDRIHEVAPLLQAALVLAQSRIESKRLAAIPRELIPVLDVLSEEDRLRGFLRTDVDRNPPIANWYGILTLVRVVWQSYGSDMALAARERHLDEDGALIRPRELSHEWIDGAVRVLARLRLEAYVEAGDANGESEAVAATSEKRTRRAKGEAARIVAEYLAEHAFESPSVRDVAAATGIRPSTVARQPAWKKYDGMRQRGEDPRAIEAAMRELLNSSDVLRKLVAEQEAEEREQSTRRHRAARERGVDT